MRLVLFAFPLAIGLGYLLGGRLHHLGGTRFRHAWAGLAGVVLQVLPADGTLGFVVLVASFALLLFVAWMNRRLAGFALVVAGLCLNFVVIAVNEGMPVTRAAIVASDQAETLDDIRDAGGTKHHLATPDDDLLFLADRIGIPAPVKQAVSIGDILAYAGVIWFVVAAMRRQIDDDSMSVPAAEAST
jgi:hypothetical protein